MKKIVIFSILAVLLIAGGTAGVFFYINKDKEPETQDTAQQQETKIEYTGVKGRTALQTLKDFVGKTNVENTGSGGMTSGESTPVEVQTINGVTADSTKEYWSFSVNGELMDEDPGTYMTNDGDVIVWELKSL